ncbi:efflux RND transporter permease subunit [Xanthomonas fragariae]|nr:efflux RND transporter permease subunit [Xanthomonas fragariae]AOD13704.1 hypothetical protein BER92_01870 [Xanthomonas fragariae]AOD17094.1 hypothetical protein BER93_01860 [Xanthomonas fragariae]MBL9197428.1 efflux RND transporter permease subunit [Xanthomonas fragariae]MBL9222565.1 efflux RND transporter permease subunit [Xanthomonas fragariae]WIY72187.1 efflux RND transporter permease subunit [Xanthomonas fragariae]
MLNTLTLLALAMVVGILVDDAIVEIENIEHHRRMGKSAFQATADAVNEIALVVTATTATLVVVFVPTTLMGGIPGLFFKQFGWTAVIAVVASLLVARLITPIMAARFLSSRYSDRPEPATGAVTASYLRMVQWSLRHRAATLGAAGVFLLLSLALLPLLSKGLVPPSDRGTITVKVELGPESDIDQTRQVTERVRAAVDRIDGVGAVFTNIGGNAAGRDAQVAEVRKAEMTLVLSERKTRAPQTQIEREVRRVLVNITGARATVSGSGPGEQLSMILTSDSEDALNATASAFAGELRAAGLSGVRTPASLERPELVARPIESQTARYGVSSADIRQTLRTATSGDFEPQLAKLNLDNRQINIRVQVPDRVSADLDALSNLRVQSRDGLMPLSSVAVLAMESGPTQIDRDDRQRYVTVSADLSDMPLSKALALANTRASIQHLPSNVSLIQSGDAEVAADLSSGLLLAIVIASVCMLCVLILLFSDFFQPLTILSAIPLSLGGAFVALLLFGSELDVPSMIGLVMLMGIVTKNSILLVEYAVIAIRDGAASVEAALIDAYHKRARPIVMTTMAMIAGMLPIALGFGADASFRQPMAIAVIGGLISSTLLCLVVVPAVFSCIHDVQAWVHRRWRSAVGTQADPADSQGRG